MREFVVVERRFEEQDDAEEMLEFCQRNPAARRWPFDDPASDDPLCVSQGSQLRDAADVPYDIDLKLTNVANCFAVSSHHVGQLMAGLISHPIDPRGPRCSPYAGHVPAEKAS